MSTDIAPADNTAAEPAPASGNLPAPAQPAAPDQPKTFGSVLAGIINFVTLGARFMALATAAVFLKEGMHLLKKRMHDDSAKAVRISEMCGQAGVDPYFQGLVIDASQSLERVAEASGALADTADGMEANARGVRDAHEAEYRGVYEVRQGSPYEQPKPGFSEVR